MNRGGEREMDERSDKMAARRTVFGSVCFLVLVAAMGLFCGCDGFDGLFPPCRAGLHFCVDHCVDWNNTIAPQCSLCGPSMIFCDNQCLDGRSDPNHCGACGNACETGPGTGCKDGRCFCPGGLEFCEGRCMDPHLSATCCPLLVNMAWCDGKCIDVSADPSNCHACGIKCPAGSTCLADVVNHDVSPACSCAKGLTACFTFGGNVECLDTGTDPNNCGRCGKSCRQWIFHTACESGQCCIPKTGDCL